MDTQMREFGETTDGEVEIRLACLFFPQTVQNWYDLYLNKWRGNIVAQIGQATVFSSHRGGG